MDEVKIIEPFDKEFPSEYANRLGICYAKKMLINHKKEKGQFFTPISIANYMSSYCNLEKSKIKILDPGCGASILSCTLIERLIRNKKIESIELIVYEIDAELVKFTKKALDYLKEWILSKDIKFKYKLNIQDFILNSAKRNFKDKYDVIISNPPYFKLPKDDERVKVAKDFINGQPNIYSLFMGIASKLLLKNGELIFITPRSFASGDYFKTFREKFFSNVQIEGIHLFNSRKEAFSKDNVLQELVIIKAKKEENTNPDKKVDISSSDGLNNIFDSLKKKFILSKLVDLSSEEKILHLPISEKEESVLNIVDSWTNKLSDFDIYISTGPVVAYRSWDYIKENYEVNIAPLFWLNNVYKMVLEWPKQLNNKGQYIKIENESKSILIPNKNYILLRRFSSKDDKSRLIAAPYFCNYFNSDYIGVENKVNYIYRKNGHLNRDEIVGLCALLNSNLFDVYFQTFNGNVNVSATELRIMKFPSLEIIKKIGNKIILSNDFSLNNVNNIIKYFFI